MLRLESPPSTLGGHSLHATATGKNALKPTFVEDFCTDNYKRMAEWNASTLQHPWIFPGIAVVEC